MADTHAAKRAFGAPGIAPRWTQSAKDAIGTAYSAGSTVWFTVSAGILNEVYHPTIDRPQIRDLQYLVTDGQSFFHDERRHHQSRLEPLSDHSLGVRITSTARDGRYRIVKEVIADPHQPCVLIRTRLEGEEDLLAQLQLCALLAPHLDIGGWDNTGCVAEAAGRPLLTAHKHGVWLAMAATVPWLRRSCGYVGTSDGWTDLAQDFRMDWEFDVAEHGNIALLGELDVHQSREFTLGLAFGRSLHHASTTLLQSIGIPFAQQRDRFIDQWGRACRRLVPLAATTGACTTPATGSSSRTRTRPTRER